MLILFMLLMMIVIWWFLWLFSILLSKVVLFVLRKLESIVMGRCEEEEEFWLLGVMLVGVMLEW